MKPKARNPSSSLLPRLWWCAAWALLAAACACPAVAQTCQTSSDLDDAVRGAITAAAQRYFEMASKGDTAGLRQNALPSLLSDFSSVDATIKDHQAELAGATAAAKSVFLLETEGSAPIARAEFYCGVFGKNGQTAGSAVFTLTNLPPGRYAVVLLESTSPTGRTSFSPILQPDGAAWKLGGLYIKSALAAGHDGDWFAARAREYKGKGQMHNAWLYSVQARDMISPLSFMSTLATDRLYDEFQSLQPADVPVEGSAVDLSSGSATYKLTRLRLIAVGNDLDLLVRYSVADATNADQSYQSNVAVAKAVVTKYPEVREAFAGVISRAVDASGRDYGTLLAMKDVK